MSEHNTTLSYGGVTLSPTPFLSIDKTYNKSRDGKILGTTFNVTLEGTLTPVGTDDDVNILAVVELMSGLRDTFSKDGHRLLLECDGSTLMDAYPRINSVAFAPESTNWVQKTPYTIQLEFDNEPNNLEDAGHFDQLLKDASESWDVEFVEDNNFFSWSVSEADGQASADVAPYALRISHSVSAVGQRHFEASATASSGALDKEAWEQARDYVETRLGYDATKLSSTGILNLDSDIISVFNHMRTSSVDETEGSFSVVETFLGVPTGIDGVIDGALEDFQIDIHSSAGDALTTVGINGTVHGLEERSYGSGQGADSFSIRRSKFEAASGYYADVKTRLLDRVTEAWQLEQSQPSGRSGSGTVTTTYHRALHPRPIEISVGYNPKAGTVQYSQVYNTRPLDFITGAISENITVNDKHPTNHFASVVVLGRANGPVLQNLETVTVGTRQVSIDALVLPPSGNTKGKLGSQQALMNARPRNDVTGILAGFEYDLTSVYDQVFKTADDESWNVKTGQYSRQVGWTFSNCSSDWSKHGGGSAPGTTFITGTWA